jgi:hypothetical protein
MIHNSMKNNGLYFLLTNDKQEITCPKAFHRLYKRLSAYGFYYVGGTVKEYLFYLSLILIFYIIYLYCRKDSQESLIILLLFIFTLVLFRVQIL